MNDAKKVKVTKETKRLDQEVGDVAKPEHSQRKKINSEEKTMTKRPAEGRVPECQSDQI